ncbi:MAG TPA: hypothetical protein VMM78_14450 [Thermomicrobiales bacterium]|nr:hypothetical protein [Thermomicrobiales bacterium]
MWIAIAYVALMAYAAGLFVYAVTHERPSAAIGILLSVSGFQFAVLKTVNPEISIAIALLGLVFVARDVVMSLLPRVALVSGRERAE